MSLVTWGLFKPLYLLDGPNDTADRPGTRCEAGVEHSTEGAVPPSEDPIVLLLIGPPRHHNFLSK